MARHRHSVPVPNRGARAPEREAFRILCVSSDGLTSKLLHQVGRFASKPIFQILICDECDQIQPQGTLALTLPIPFTIASVSIHYL